jgi:diaminohydroxyphosphoribosylaminopyrimidine deaminase/5-amino-6-(5-phosphoribosylamino)uracil reductase
MGIANDEEAMRVAIDIAATARRTVSPRPWVGAVVVTADGESFAGATDGRDGPHAEVVALRQAGEKARGATLYVTLEPCSHHGRTPPCAEAVVAAGIARCVVAVADPDDQVDGSGIQHLRDAGIATEVGLLEHEVRAQLAPYLTHRRTGRPYVVLKLAGTLDGRSAAPDGSSQWITGEPARQDAHRLRADSDAILVGAATVRADDPSLTVRLPAGEAEGVEPLRIVLGTAPAGATVHPCLERAGELEPILDELGRRGILQLMVEGGARVAHDFHAAGLVDRYVLYLAPALFGGDDARGLFAGAGAPDLASIWRGELVALQQLGDDIRVDMVPRTDGAARRGES